ncbi:MAG: M1 family metallopeptidase [Acidobacteriota bacterium]
MMRQFAVALGALICCVPPLFAQHSVADSSPFRQLPLPAANEIRSGSGRPGPAYWQQQVDYTIEVTLDVEANELRGTETIRYRNNSPDPLPYLWMHLEQNMCTPTSVTNQLDQPPLVFLDAEFDFSCKGFDGGLVLERLQAGGTDLPHTIYDTTMRVDLPAPLGPGAQMELEIAWRFPVPEYGSGRMGHDGTLYEIAQWYPRLAVYDDVRGWNHEPYIGAGEFYLEYGDFDVALIVPASYIVAATGVLQNADEVLTAEQRARLARAADSETPVGIITAQEAGNVSLTRPPKRGTITWRFIANNVRDFAFAAGPELRWDASGYNGILIETLYRPSATLWEEANRMARAAIRHFSERWFPYPYPHATTVEGPIAGMEYPMLTFVPNSPAREEQQWVLSHEFGHEWFPMLVGSNERLYPWMDEGFNTFIDLEGAARYFAGSDYGDSIESNPLRLYPEHAIPGKEQPLITRPVEVQDLFWTAYQKPALMMSLLRDEVLGRERFERAFREYIRAWAYKHPTPADFFRLMRDVSGMELDWFWRGWIFTTSRLDQAVESVSAREDDGTDIVLANRGTMVMPLELEITFADGTSDTVKLPVQMWNLGPRFTYKVSGSKAVDRVVVDPRKALPDTDRSNNSWLR